MLYKFSTAEEDKVQFKVLPLIEMILAGKESFLVLILNSPKSSERTASGSPLIRTSAPETGRLVTRSTTRPE